MYQKEKNIVIDNPNSASFSFPIVLFIDNPTKKSAKEIQ
jgi:hypothetical protein